MKIERSTRADKKLMAIFDDGTVTHFGAVGYSDYTQHKDRVRRDNYLRRHSVTQDWTDPTKAGTLSAYILWGPFTNMHKNIKYYKQTFGFRV